MISEQFKENQDALKYKPEYADQLYEHMKKGLGISSFNVEPPVWRSTIMRWVQTHPEFAAAKEKGEAEFLRLLATCAYSKALGLQVPALEKLGSKKMDGEMIRFLLRTKFKGEYSEKIDLSSEDGTMTPKDQVVFYLPDNKRDKKK